ncbi:MAG: hypothetical protein ACRDIE_08115, partial [Chloroflexota bacterium]
YQPGSGTLLGVDPLLYVTGQPSAGRTILFDVEWRGQDSRRVPSRAALTDRSRSADRHRRSYLAKGYERLRTTLIGDTLSGPHLSARASGCSPKARNTL